MSDKKDVVNISGINSPPSQNNISLTKVTEIDTLKTRLCNYIDTAETNYTENFEEKWNFFMNQYEGRMEKPEGSAAWRSSIASQLIFQACQDEMPKSLDGLIGEGDFFALQPRPGKEYLLNKGLAYQELIRYFYDKADFYSKVHDALLYSKQLGIGWVKQTWHGMEKVKEKYVEKDGVLAEERTEQFEQGILFEVIDPNRAFPDPDAESMEELNEGGYFVTYTWVTRSVIDGMKNDIGALKSEIKDFMALANEQDEFERYQLYCVYTAKENYMLVTGNGADYVVKRLSNQYDHGNIPVYPVYKFRKQNCIIGTGIAEKLSDYSTACSDAMNLFFDNWMISVNTHIAVKNDTTIDPNLQAIEPGSVSYWDNPREDVNVLKLGQSNPQDMNIIQTFMGLSQQVVGTSAGITTPQGIQTVNNQTATGAAILNYNENQGISLEVKINRDSFLKKILRDGIDLIKQYCTKEMVDRILPKEKAKLVNVEEDKDKFWDDFDFIIKGETGFVGKQREMQKASMVLQLIPAVEQVATAVPTFNKKVYYDMVFGMLDIPKEIIQEEPEPTELNLQDYTPEEQQQLAKVSQVTGIPIEQIIERMKNGEKISEIVSQVQEGTNAVQPAVGVSTPQEQV